MYYEVGYVAGLALTLAMGLSVIFLQPRRREARLWALLSLLVSLWFLVRFLMYRAQTVEQAQSIMRLAYIPIALINPTYYHFCLALVRRRATRLVYAGYSLALTLGLINMFSNLLVSGVVEGRYSLFYERAGPLYWLELLNYTIYPALGVVVLIISRKTADAFKKRQLDYMLAAAAVGFLCGLTTMPLVYRWHMPPFAAPLVAVYPVVSTYAILRHQLLDIRIIIRRTLIYSMLTAFFSVFYVTILAIGSRVLDRWSASSGLVSSAAAAALVAIFFHPFKVRLNRWVDRHFPRESLNQEILREATGRFVHEIKRPLANISMPAQLALSDIERLIQDKTGLDQMLPKLARHLKYIVDESIMAGAKIEAICNITSQNSQQRRNMDLAALVFHVLDQEKPRMYKEGIVLTHEGLNKASLVVADARQVEISIANVVKNAIDALAESDKAPKRLELTLKSEFRKIILEVKDTGVGIPEQYLYHLFDPWFSTKRSGGMGIGLYLTREILKLNDASIEVESQPGKGSLFRFIFVRTSVAS
jgi:signal transduction histidine kinase